MTPNSKLEPLPFDKKRNGPLTATNQKFESQTSFKQPIFSPQNLSSFLFQPAKQNDMRRNLLKDFLKSNIPASRFEELTQAAQTLGEEEFVGQLKPGEKKYENMIRSFFFGAVGSAKIQ